MNKASIFMKLLKICRNYHRNLRTLTICLPYKKCIKAAEDRIVIIFAGYKQMS